MKKKNDLQEPLLLIVHLIHWNLHHLDSILNFKRYKFLFIIYFMKYINVHFIPLGQYWYGRNKLLSRFLYKLCILNSRKIVPIFVHNYILYYCNGCIFISFYFIKWSNQLYRIKSNQKVRSSLLFFPFFKILF